MLTYTDCELTIDGNPFPVRGVSVDRIDAAKRSLESELTRVYEASVTYSVTLTHRWSLFMLGLEAGHIVAWLNRAHSAMVYQPPRGASPETLAKRVRYASRKGRAAMRRLRKEMGYVTAIVTDLTK